METTNHHLGAVFTSRLLLRHLAFAGLSCMLLLTSENVVAQIPPPALQSADWATPLDANLVTTNNGGLKRTTTGTTWPDAIANQKLVRDGRIVFKVKSGFTAKVAIGLNFADTAASDTDIDFRLVVTSSATVASNKAVALTGTVQTGAFAAAFTSDTVFTIERIGSEVKFTQDNGGGAVQTFTSTVPCAGTMMVDAAFQSQNSELLSCQIDDGDVDNDGMPDAWELASMLPNQQTWAHVEAFLPSEDADDDGVENIQEFRDGTPANDRLTYTDAFNKTPSAQLIWEGVRGTKALTDGKGGLRKLTSTDSPPGPGAGYNADAVSSRAIMGDGKLVFTASTDTVMAVGFTHVNDSYLNTDLEWSFVFAADETFDVTGLTLSSPLGTYTEETVFTIQRVGSKIQFLKDGVLLHTATLESTSPLIVDCSLSSVNAQITSARLYTGDVDGDGLPDGWERHWLPSNAGFADLDGFDPEGNDDATMIVNNAVVSSGDSIKNIDEWKSGTSPVDELSQAPAVVWDQASGRIKEAEPISGSTTGGLRKTSSSTNASSRAFGTKPILQDGLLAFQVSQLGSMTFGLNTSDVMPVSTSVTPDIEWGFVFVAGGTFSLESNGAAVAISSPLSLYNASTRFVIQRVGGQVLFLKDGIVIHTGTVASLGPLYVNAWLTTAAMQVSMARIYAGDVDEDGMLDEWELKYLPAGANRHNLNKFTASDDPNASDDESDPDGDGMNNGQEFRDGTNPRLSEYWNSVGWIPSSTVNLELVGGSKDGIKKIAPVTAAWNSGAVSSSSMSSAGILTFSLKSSSLAAVGLTLANTNLSYTDLEYSVYGDASGNAFVYEGSANKAALGSYNSNTRFAIRRLGSQVSVYKDGIHVYESAAALSAHASLLVDSSFNTVGSEVLSSSLYRTDLDGDLMLDDWEALQWMRSHNQAIPSLTELQSNFLPDGNADGDTFTNFQEYTAGSDPLQPLSQPVWVEWSNLSNGTAPGNGNFTKNAGGNAYNADATSTQYLKGNGTLNFTTAPGVLAVGLTYADDNNTQTDLDYSFVLSATDAKVHRPEIPATDLSVGAYTSTTIFGIRRTGTTIEYMKDGVVVYTSTTPSTGNLYADFSIYTSGHQLTGARLFYFDENRDIDNDDVPDDWELQYLPIGATSSTLLGFNNSSDTDGLSLLNEYLNGTSPLSDDTDGDGMNDLWEVTNFLDPLSYNPQVDTDDDGLTNIGERIAGTNPRDPDTDDDGIPDGYEADYLKPLDPTDALTDFDGDRVPNLWEYVRGTAANSALSVPIPDAEVDPASSPSLAAAINSLPAGSATRYIVKLKRGVHNAANLDLSGASARMIAFVGELNPTPGNAASKEGAIVRGSSWLLTGETVISGIIFEGGSGVRLAPPAPGPGQQPARVHLMNCLMRGIQPYRDTGAPDAGHGGVLTNQGAKLSLEHCTLWRCGSWTNGGVAVATIANLSGTLTLKNSILWDDQFATNTPISGPTGAITVQTSLLQGGFGGAINISPVLTSRGYLTSSSTHCLTAGGATTELLDLHLQERPATTPTLGAVQWLIGGLPAHLTDSDGDGLLDVEETAAGTSSLLADTDGDGVTDDLEILHGTDPLDKSSSVFSTLKILTPPDAAQ